MSKKQASIFDIWEELLQEGKIKTLAELSRRTGVPYKWLKDFFNDRYVARQVYYIKKIERELEVGNLNLERYNSGDDDE